MPSMGRVPRRDERSRHTAGDRRGFFGRIGGTCGLETTGSLSDSLTLRGANTYSGATTVAGGSLVLDTWGRWGPRDS
jgi:autotransporter-associated beta strand protein